MKKMFLSLLFPLVLILVLLSSAKARNVVISKFEENASSYRVIKLDSRDDRKVETISLKDQEDDEGDDEDDDEGDDNDDEEKG